MTLDNVRHVCHRKSIYLKLTKHAFHTMANSSRRDDSMLIVTMLQLHVLPMGVARCKRDF